MRRSAVRRFRVVGQRPKKYCSSAFLQCKQKIAPGATLNANLVELVDAAKKIWERLLKGVVVIGGLKKPINGEIAMIFKADDLQSSEKILLRSYLKTTQNIAGCQAVRRRIGHCLFGFRVVYGECIFVTVSPNRRHSTLILKLSRSRCNDVSLRGTDRITNARRRYATADQPPIFVDGYLDDPESVEEATAKLNLPSLPARQGANAQDPLSSSHHYFVCMYVLVPAAFGLRMCLNCPHCNYDEHDPCAREPRENARHHACQDMCGKNSRPLGGYAGRRLHHGDLIGST